MGDILLSQEFQIFFPFFLLGVIFVLMIGFYIIWKIVSSSRKKTFQQDTGENIVNSLESLLKATQLEGTSSEAPDISHLTGINVPGKGQQAIQNEKVNDFRHLQALVNTYQGIENARHRIAQALVGIHGLQEAQNTRQEKEILCEKAEGTLASLQGQVNFDSAPQATAIPQQQQQAIAQSPASAEAEATTAEVPVSAEAEATTAEVPVSAEAEATTAEVPVSAEAEVPFNLDDLRKLIRETECLKFAYHTTNPGQNIVGKFEIREKDARAITNSLTAKEKQGKLADIPLGARALKFLQEEYTPAE